MYNIKTAVYSVRRERAERQVEKKIRLTAIAPGVHWCVSVSRNDKKSMMENMDKGPCLQLDDYHEDLLKSMFKKW